ncbi:MAG TPA: alanine racemase [Acidobacteriaceae bacterium]|nr:alanine racemase [Acidobacteriaceae bacterium]
MHTRPIWAEISRSRLLSNFKKLQAVAAPHAGLLAVVKADAYGHDVNLCSPWLAEAGAEWLGVTSIEEGVAVRRLCPQARILGMCGIWPGDEEAVLEHELVPTVWTAQHIELLAQAAERRNAANGSIPVHLEIDTGMSRQGVGLDELLAILDRIRATPALCLDGVFTHFSSTEMLDSPQNDAQQQRFAEALQSIAAAGLHPTWIHAGNSSTLLAQDRLTPLSKLARQYGGKFLVRPGLALYGYALPFVQADGAQTRKMPVALEPVLRWKTRIAALRTIEAGMAVGYGATYVAAQTMQLALLPVGYADGLNRRLSNCGSVLVRGHRAAIVGRVSMDLTVVDVSQIPNVAVGDEVALIGEQSGADGSMLRVTAEDQARWAGTISYEILCAISVRVARVGVE